MRAYPEGAAQKSSAVAAIEAAIASENLPGEDRARPASLAAIIAGSADPRAYERTMGIPGSLALLGDEVLASYPEPEPARVFARSWVAAPEPGADLGGVPGAILLWFLDWALASGVASNDATLQELMIEIRSKHHELLQGSSVDRASWADARRRALAFTDAAEGDSVLMGRLAETLAWPPLTARTVIAESLRIFADLVALLAQRTSGMGDEERAAVRAVMDKLYEDTSDDREANPDTYDFPGHFEARFPDEFARFVADMNIGNDAFATAFADTGKYALSLIINTRA